MTPGLLASAEIYQTTGGVAVLLQALLPIHTMKKKALHNEALHNEALHKHSTARAAGEESSFSFS